LRRESLVARAHAAGSRVDFDVQNSPPHLAVFPILNKERILFCSLTAVPFPGHTEAANAKTQCSSITLQAFLADSYFYSLLYIGRSVLWRDIFYRTAAGV
jgi:hypothetical protein